MFLATLRRHRCGGESAKHFAFESKTICRRLGVSNRGSLGYVQTSVPIVPFRLPFWVLWSESRTRTRHTVLGLILIMLMAGTVASLKMRRALSVAARPEPEQRTRRQHKRRVHYASTSNRVRVTGPRAHTSLCGLPATRHVCLPGCHPWCCDYVPHAPSASATPQGHHASEALPAAYVDPHPPATPSTPHPCT